MSGKKIKYPIHKMGKTCGYDEYEDGSIKVASIHCQKIDNAMLQEAAVDALLKSVTEQCRNLLIPVMEARRRFWKDVTEDYSFDPNKYSYAYDSVRRVVTKVLKEAPE